MHYVSLPGDGQDKAQEETFILASRTQPTTVASQNLSRGVQQLVILPRAKKACILCNGTLTFHTLPELSPAPNTQTVSNVLWIGGIDLDDVEGNELDEGEDFVMMGLRTKIRLLRVGEIVRSPKPLDYSGCLDGARRGKFACVADSRSYSLIDLENSQKIPLFPISSLDETAIPPAERQVQSSIESPASHGPRSSSLSLQATQTTGQRGHGRNTSLGAFVTSLAGRQVDQGPRSPNRSGLNSPEPGSRLVSPARPRSSIDASRPMSPNNATLGLPPAGISPERPPSARSEQHESLQPFVSSPVSGEFLLLTGTSSRDPGVGMFVNLDGDVVRGTIEFSHYPIKIALDGGQSLNASTQGLQGEDSEGFVLAAIEKTSPGGPKHGFEIQRWDVQGSPRSWLEIPATPWDGCNLPTFGISTTKTAVQLYFSEIGRSLRSQRLVLKGGNKASQTSEETQRTAAETARDAQEDEFASMLGQVNARNIAWSEDQVWWVAKNPTLLKLEAVIQQILDECKDSRLDQVKLIRVLKSIRNQEARSETEFLSLEYVRQKISLILFADLAVNRDDFNPQINEQLLIDSGADPRLILSMVPFLRKDLFEGPSGIWVHAGLVSLMQERLSKTAVTLEADEVLSRPEDLDILGIVKRYLTAWRQRKGFGSIADETFVFSTVDAALLHVLLYQDQQSSLGPGASPTLRAELYAIVDSPVNCFERAIELLEEYHRLYVLSRLYQSRRMSRKVLETWKRILEGARDDGGGFTDGESEMRRYLTNRGDRALVEEFGGWLARRNPKLGVEIFTDDTAKVKFTPAQAVQILRQCAPDAVKVYLEHLVFSKKNVQYANDLITYYLDSVLSVLSSSPEALTFLSNSYQNYRALVAPKPTYRQYITDNSINEAWWHDRLRLLELLGGSYGTGFAYDVPAVLARIEPFEDALVPESIILDGRQGRHAQALRLLTHGLGDYHTAINYCLLGGSSIFHPAEAGTAVGAELPKPTQDEQATLFSTLFTEFLSIADEADRVERVSELLARFGSWFDVRDVLSRVPEEWSIDALSEFLIAAMRKLVSERNESGVVKALSGAENLKVAAKLVEKVEVLGPHIVPAMDTPNSMV